VAAAARSVARIDCSAIPDARIVFIDAGDCKENCMDGARF